MLEFHVKPAPGNKKTRKLIDQWPHRLEAFIEALPRRIAEQLHQDVVKLAPSDLPGYPDMLKAVEFPRQGDWQIAGVIPPGWNFSQRLKTSDAQRTILTVKPKMVGGKVVSEAAVVLARNNPWTMATLPWEPTRREASLVSRRVNEQDVKDIEQQRQLDRPAIVAELRELGVSIRPKDKVLLGRRVTRDLAFEILRREKGIGVPGHAHWRPAVQAIFSQHLKKTMKELAPWMSDPENEEWEARQNLPVEAASVIKRVQEFQKRIVPGGA